MCRRQLAGTQRVLIIAGSGHFGMYMQWADGGCAWTRWDICLWERSTDEGREGTSGGRGHEWENEEDREANGGLMGR